MLHKNENVSPVEPGTWQGVASMTLTAVDQGGACCIEFWDYTLVMASPKGIRGRIEETSGNPGMCQDMHHLLGHDVSHLGILTLHSLNLFS